MKATLRVRHLTTAFATVATLATASVASGGQPQAPIRLGAQGQPQGPETFTATATVKSAAGPTVSAPVVFSITRWTTDDERAKAVAAVKSGDSAAIKATLGALPEAGTIQIGSRTTPIRYARSLGTGSSRVITVVAPEPILYLGEGAPGAKPKAGYDLAFATFLIDASGKGNAGDLAPAAKLKLGPDAAIIVEDYGTEAVRLTGIAKK